MAQLTQAIASDPKLHVPLSVVQKAEEQRAYPRFKLNVTATFRNAAGNRCTGRVVNISPDGLQVKCNPATGQMLHPKGGRICPSNAPVVQVGLQLPVLDETKKLIVGAQLVYATTHECDPYCVLGFRFLELRPTAQRIIDNYFMERMTTYYEPTADGGMP